MNICKLIGHRWKYNFSTQPSKRICNKCSHKERFDWSKLEWYKVEEFEVNTGTDSELKNRWVSKVLY